MCAATCFMQMLCANSTEIFAPGSSIGYRADQIDLSKMGKIGVRMLCCHVHVLLCVVPTAVACRFCKTTCPKHQRSGHAQHHSCESGRPCQAPCWSRSLMLIPDMIIPESKQRSCLCQAFHLHSDVQDTHRLSHQPGCC